MPSNSKGLESSLKHKYIDDEFRVLGELREDKLLVGEL